jgi:hypothetical protein
MNATIAPKSRAHSQLEGFALTTLFQSFPSYAAAVLLLKLAGNRDLVGDPGVAIFVTVASLTHALLAAWLGPKFPRFFRTIYEPLFFDARLSLSAKIEQWRTQPIASLQPVTIVLMLSVLAVGVASVG